MAFAIALIGNATVTVNVRTTTGIAPYLYAWDGAGVAINGYWPGTQMDATQTYVTVDGKVWFTQTFDEDAINIIFNDGGVNGLDTFIQTNSINGVSAYDLILF